MGAERWISKSNSLVIVGKFETRPRVTEKYRAVLYSIVMYTEEEKWYQRLETEGPPENKVEDEKKRTITHLIRHTGTYMDSWTYRWAWWYPFCRMWRPWRDSVRRNTSYSCGRCVNGASTGKSDRSGRRDRQARFTVISFYLLFLFFVCFLFELAERMTRVFAAELAERKRERERGRAATRVRRRRGEARCGREKSFNVKVTWAHAHRIDVRRRETGRKRPRGRETA